MAADNTQRQTGRAQLNHSQMALAGMYSAVSAMNRVAAASVDTYLMKHLYNMTLVSGETAIPSFAGLPPSDSLTDHHSQGDRRSRWQVVRPSYTATVEASHSQPEAAGLIFVVGCRSELRQPRAEPASAPTPECILASAHGFVAGFLALGHADPSSRKDVRLLAEKTGLI